MRPCGNWKAMEMGLGYSGRGLREGKGEIVEKTLKDGDWERKGEDIRKGYVRIEETGLVD